MKITAVTVDQIIIFGGVVAQMREIGGYHMTNGEWAVHFDTTLGHGHIEYLDNRNNQTIDQAFFDQHYAWLIDEHQRFIKLKEAEQNGETQAAEPLPEQGA